MNKTFYRHYLHVAVINVGPNALKTFNTQEVVVALLNETEAESLVFLRFEVLVCDTMTSAKDFQ